MVDLHHELHLQAAYLCDLKAQGLSTQMQLLWPELQSRADALITQLQLLLPRRAD
jgi:hypothetical protein